MEPVDLEKLIQKYINGTATDLEKEELLAWYRRFDGDDKLLMPYHIQDEEDEAKQRLMHGIKQKIAAISKPTSNLKQFYWLGAAAAVLLVGLFVAIKASSFFNGRSVIYGCINTNAGQRKVITLNDGSVIWLSAKSSVRFPDSFPGATREISLEGEAFFDIAKDKKHPFIVHAGNLSTRVLGTTFNIDAYTAHKNVVVALITGKVAFSDGKSLLKITPNHEVVYNKAKGVSSVVSIPDVSAVTGRRNGQYEYKNSSVGDIIEDVNRNFDMNIQVEGGLKDSTFYGRINAGESPQKFLNKMAIVVNATIIKTNKGYLLKRGGGI